MYLMLIIPVQFQSFSSRMSDSSEGIPLALFRGVCTKAIGHLRSLGHEQGNKLC